VYYVSGGKGKTTAFKPVRHMHMHTSCTSH
jgi:hypothetical protein